MYPVSDAYLAARRSRVREERITGGIKLKDGTIITVDDTVIIQNSLSISKKVCSSSKFDIGTMNCSVLEMKLVDDSAYDHEFGGALIKLTYGLVTGVDEEGNKVWEEVPLPPFIADGREITRKWNVISITAYDYISLLNIDYPGTIPTDSLYVALQYVCNRAGMGLAISEEEFNALPNSGVIPDFSSSQIESCCDAAMWIAQTVNCCGFVDYRGLLNLKQFKYAGGNNYDRLFTEDEIKDIKYSDTRTYLAYLQAYVNGNVKLYSKVTTWTGTDAPHIKEGALSLPKNPILSKLTEDEQTAVNSSYLENRSYPTRYIKMTGWVDPALELMDVVAFSGQMIDVGQIINVATQIKWCYGKSGTIYCASISENSESATENSTAVMTMAVTEEDTSSSINRVQPKSQIEKRLDDVEAQVQINASGGVGMKSPLDPTSEIFNCYEGDGANIAGQSGSAYYAHAEGKNTRATGFYSHAEGLSTEASGYFSHAEGASTKASGYYSHAEGNVTKASGNFSHAEGEDTQATALYAHAEGFLTVSSAEGSHAEGLSTKASQKAAHAEGQSTEASGYCSHAEGQLTKATSFESHAEGYYTQATEFASHAEGNYTVASGNSSHAEGSSTQATGTFSHAEGGSCVASGNQSHAGGYSSEANGYCSFAHGYRVIVNDMYPEEYPIVAFGQYNNYSSDDKYLFVIGNGTADDKRSNAFAVDIDGNIYCKSVIQIGEVTAASLLSDDSDTPTYTAQSDNVVEYDGITYTFTVDDTGAYTGVTTSTGKSMIANIPAELGNTTTHNAAFMALAIMSLK